MNDITDTPALDELVDDVQEMPEQPSEPEDKPADDKGQKREGYQMRQMQKQLDALKAENEGFKRRSDEERKAKLTEEQRIREERDQFAQEIEKLKTERLQEKVRAKYKIPDAIPLVGSDEEALNAHAQEIARYLPKPKIGSITDPVRDHAGAKTYKRSELRNNPMLAASPEVRQAARENRIIDDL